ncbi:MAG: flagellar biosynthetic protein FliO [Gemmataceae bacterium]
MQPSPGPLFASAPLKKWLPLGGLCVAAVLAGLFVPQLISPAPPAQKSAERPTEKLAPGAKASDAKKPDGKTPDDKAPDAKAKTGAWSYAPPSWPEQPNTGAMFLRLGIGTVVVLAMCVATILLCKRWLGGTAAASATNTHLKRIETLALPQRCWVHLVHVGAHPVLVGGDAKGITTIVPLPESFATTLEQADAGPSVLAEVIARRFSANLDQRENGEA